MDDCSRRTWMQTWKKDQDIRDHSDHQPAKNHGFYPDQLSDPFHQRASCFQWFLLRYCSQLFSFSTYYYLKIKFNTLSKWQFGTPVDGIGLPAHILFPGIRS